MSEYPVYIRVQTEKNRNYFEKPSAAEAVISALVNAQNQGWMRLHGFVVLPDALEMVLSPIRQGVAGIVAHVQAEMLPVLSVILPEAMFIWSVSYSNAQIETQTALNARLQMLALAPVAHSLCDIPTEYPYSSSNARYKANVAVYAGFVRMLPPDAHSIDTGPLPSLDDEDNVTSSSG